MWIAISDSLARAQQSLTAGAHESVLPDAPKPVEDGAQTAAADSSQSGTANISGTILDSNGSVVPGALVKLLSPSGSIVQTRISGRNGEFQFAGLPEGSYKLRVSGPDMAAFTSEPIPLHSGEFRIASPITLAVSGGETSVIVNGGKEELSREQVHIAVQQRVAGVIPNFYSSYDWNAPPMQAKQKIQLSVRSLIDPVSFLAVAGIAAAEQNRNIFPSYGGGIEGYGKRYGAAMANRASGALLGRAIYPAIFHQDPRYFYKGKGSIRSRALYAISAAVMTRSDSGRWEPNYSQVLGNFSAAALSNLYYPEADRGGSLVLMNGLSETGANAASNLIREFLLKPFTSRAANSTSSQP
jgi:Carboxypeptidase regulatory-like domain